MNGPVIVIADPNRIRRNMLLELCAEAGLHAVVASGSLSETYQLAEMHRPKRVALAVEFTKTAEFQALTDLLTYISAELILYGEGPDAATGSLQQPVSRERARRFVDSLAAGLGIGASTSVQKAVTETAPRKITDSPNSLVLIGTSTGGVTALETILSDFPMDCPPTLVVQHMRSGFGEGLIRRLDDMARPKVVAAGDKVPLKPGTVHVAAGIDCHLGVVQRGGLLTRLVRGEAVSGHCPSVDVLFNHGADLADRISVTAVILTGMGAEGAAGMRRLRAAGAYTIAQDKGSSVVWGMPRVAVEMGAVVDILPLASIGRALLRDNGQRTGRQGSAGS